MSKEVYQQAALVDLIDEELLSLVGYCYEAARRSQDNMKNDPAIVRLVEELAELKKEYTDERKAYLSKLKAARRLAEARGLSFRLPEVLKNEEA